MREIFLETEHLKLILPSRDDFELILALRSDPDVMAFIGEPHNKEDVEHFFDMAIPYQEKHGFGFCSVFEKESGEFVGQAGLFHIRHYDQQPDIEIGYRLHKRYWGKGYATELTRALINWGFNHLSVEKLVAFVRPDHPRSENVLKKAGMIYVHDTKYKDIDVRCYQIYKNQYNEGHRYDAIASGFAEMRDSFNTEKKYVDLFCEALPDRAYVLDVGCGSGVPIASYLLEKGFTVLGVDASKELLRIAEKNCPNMNRVHGDIRTISLTQLFDGIIEWWCLFHLPKQDQLKMIERFAGWLKPGGILQFTTGDADFENEDADMLNQSLRYYSCAPSLYEEALKSNNFQLLMRESDQPEHLVWLAKKF